MPDRAVTVTIVCVFFFNDTATTEIYTLSLHDALPISVLGEQGVGDVGLEYRGGLVEDGDRKSKRLNSSHITNSYAVFCLKKKYTRGIPRWRGRGHAVARAGDSLRVQR